MITRWLFLISGFYFMTTSFAARAADQIYTTGPEILAARSSTILTGPIAAYSKRIVSTSEPPGPDAIPLKWVVTGRTDKPTMLKGLLAKPVAFSRSEQSPVLPIAPECELWELDYGDLLEGDEVVLFLNGEADRPVIKAIPSGVGERGLASLVRDIVAIQSLSNSELQVGWLSYVEQAPLEHGRKAALRALLQMRVDWPRLMPTLKRLRTNPTLSDEMRAYSFGIVTFGLTRGQWESNQVPVTDFLCDQFESEWRPKLMLSYILSLKLALRYAIEEAAKVEREPVRKRIVEGLKRRESTAAKTPELAEQYRQLRAVYPNIF
jgi:hypothetical protein